VSPKKTRKTHTDHLAPRNSSVPTVENDGSVTVTIPPAVTMIASPR
jgi:hypothetical protein